MLGSSGFSCGLGGVIRLIGLGFGTRHNDMLAIDSIDSLAVNYLVHNRGETVLAFSHSNDFFYVNNIVCIID